MSLNRFYNSVKRFIREKEGASGIEYAVIAAMVAAVIALASPGIQGKVTATFTAIAAAL